MQVRFRQFWPGFEPRQFFVPLLEDALGESISVTNSRIGNVDIEVWSVFQGARFDLLRRLRPRRSRTGSRLHRVEHPPLRIWYTGRICGPHLTALM